MKKTAAFVCYCLLMTAFPQFCWTAEDPAASSHEQFWEHFSFSFRNLDYVQVQKPVKSFSLFDNPDNLTSYTFEADLRPDFKANFSRVDLIFKPRLDLSLNHWNEGRYDGETDEDADFYVNEWLLRLQPIDNFFVSYGRENLQWGPAMLLSPSNPFYTQNGRNQPKKEVPGADYARLVWVPDQRWTLSLIANTDEGRKPLADDFAKTYALKTDFLANDAYGSIILAKQETTDWRLGGFLSWNLSDAVIGYAEGSATHDHNQVLVGGSYTFADGGMISIEYFHNGFGSRKDDLLNVLQNYEEKNLRCLLVRENYLLLQYYKQDNLGRWTAMVRGVAGLDDHSSTLLGLYEYSVSQHLNLFATGTLYNGNNDDEFGFLLDYEAFAGVELAF